MSGPGNSLRDRLNLQEQHEKGAEIERMVFAKLAWDQIGLTETSLCVVTLCVCLCVWLCMCVCSSTEWCLYKLKRPPIGLYGSWEPALSGSPLAISSHTLTTPLVWHVASPSCSVSQYQHSPLKQINTTCFFQLDYSYTCLSLYLRLWGPLIPHCDT